MFSYSTTFVDCLVGEPNLDADVNPSLALTVQPFTTGVASPTDAIFASYKSYTYIQ